MPLGFPRRLIASLLLFAYLLLGAGGARAFVLCLEEGGGVHVEFSLSGRCAPGCDEGADDPVADSGRALSGAVDNDCQDVGLGADQTRCRAPDPLKDQLPLVLAADRFRRDGFQPCTSSVHLRLAPQPPPYQSLTALRTVVLLN